MLLKNILDGKHDHSLPAERLAEFLKAGKVRRYHTIPDVAPSQTVAEHTFNVMLILLVFHPDPSVKLLRAAAYHDLAERWTGDIPATVKWAAPGLADCLSQIEADVEQRLELAVDLPAPQVPWLKAADILELILHAGSRALNGGDIGEWGTIVHNGMGAMKKLIDVPDVEFKSDYTYMVIESMKMLTKMTDVSNLKFT